MSAITVNSDNLSRFNKRLQKALSKHFKVEVPLHEAAELLAQALGTNNTFELQQALNKNKAAFTSPYEQRAQQLIDFIQHYFSQSSQTAIQNFNFVVSSEANMSNLQVLAFSQQFAAFEGLGLYFSDNLKKDSSAILAKELRHLKLTAEDTNFLETVCEKYFYANKDENIFLASQLKKLLHIQDNSSFQSFSFYQSSVYPTYIEVNNCGFTQEFFMVAPEDYIETYSLPYTLSNTQWCQIEKNNFPIFPSFEKALQHKKKTDIVLQYCQPIEPTKKDKAICSFYFYEEKNKKQLVSVWDENLSQNYQDLTDLTRFKGRQAKEQFEFTIEHNPYGVNQPEHTLWQEGFLLNNQPLVKKKTIK